MGNVTLIESDSSAAVFEVCRLLMQLKIEFELMHKSCDDRQWLVLRVDERDAPEAAIAADYVRDFGEHYMWKVEELEREQRRSGGGEPGDVGR